MQDKDSDAPSSSFIQELATNRRAREHYSGLVSRLAADEAQERRESQRRKLQKEQEEEEEKTSASSSAANKQKERRGAASFRWQPLSHKYVLFELVWVLCVSGAIIFLEERGRSFQKAPLPQESPAQGGSVPLIITTADDTTTTQIVWTFSIIVILHSATRIFIAWHRFFLDDSTAAVSDDRDSSSKSALNKQKQKDKYLRAHSHHHNMRLRLDSGTGFASMDKLAAFVVKDPFELQREGDASNGNPEDTDTNSFNALLVVAIAGRLSLVLVAVYAWGLLYSLWHLIVAVRFAGKDRLAFVLVCAACLRRLCVLLSLY